MKRGTPGTPAHEMMKAVYDTAAARLGDEDEKRLQTGLRIAREQAGRLVVSHVTTVHTEEAGDLVKTLSIDFESGREGLPLVQRSITGIHRPLSLTHGPREWLHIAQEFQELMAEDEFIIDLRESTAVDSHYYE